MGKKLVITEKPSVAKDIAAALGGFVAEDEYLESEDLVITWAVGHLLQLADPKEYGFKSFSLALLPMLPAQWQITPRDGQKGRLDRIRKLGQRKDVVGMVNACDAGREGELIYRRIVEYTGLEGLPQQRLWLRSMTKDAIRLAFDELRPGQDLDTLADAAWLRSVGDWLVGMNASRAVTQRLGRATGTWSAGRVQTPTLAILVQREREILAHTPRPYWELTGSFACGEGESAQTWTGLWFDAARGGADRDDKPTRIYDGAEAAAWVDALASATAGAAQEKRKDSKQNPPLLYDLTTLQREANRRFGMSAKRTLDAAQRLYEGHKLTTYPRTDCRHLPDDYGPVIDTLLTWAAQLTGLDGLDDVPAVAAKVQAQGPQNLGKLLDSTQVSDHFAIIPTGNQPERELSGDDARVFELIVRQFLAALMGPATWATVERFVDVAVPASVNGVALSGPARFRTTARSLEIPGFLEALGQEEGAGTRLPPLVVGQDDVVGVPVAHLGTESESKETKPPGRYTEAQLLRMMETAGERVGDDDLSEAMKGRGLGTPATRADTIETLVKREYCRRIDSKLSPTTKAMRLIDVLERADAGALASPKLTGEWEYQLSEVERGHLTRQAVYDGLVGMTTDLTRHLVDFEHKALYEKEEPVGICPACGGVVRETTLGYSCEFNVSKEEGCRFILWKDRAGRYIDRALAKRLLTESTVGPIDGFVDRAGRRYLSGTLSLVSDPELGWTLKTEFGDAPEESDVAEEMVGPAWPCTCGQGEPHDVVETNVRWVCERLMRGEVRRGPVLPKRVCQRPMSVEEAVAYFSDAARTEILERFISKKGRPFRGLLFRKDTGKHGFEFPPRGKAAEGAATAEAGAAKAVRGGKAGAKAKKGRAAEEAGSGGLPTSDATSVMEAPAKAAKEPKAAKGPKAAKAAKAAKAPKEAKTDAPKKERKASKASPDSDVGAPAATVPRGTSRAAVALKAAKAAKDKGGPR